MNKYVHNTVLYLVHLNTLVKSYYESNHYNQFT